MNTPALSPDQRVNIAYGFGHIGGPLSAQGIVTCAYPNHGYGEPTYDIRITGALAGSMSPAAARMLDMHSGVARNISQTRLTVQTAEMDRDELAAERAIAVAEVRGLAANAVSRGDHTSADYYRDSLAHLEA